MNKLDLEKAEEPILQFQKNIYFCFTDYAKAFECVDHNKLWKILQEMRIPDHLTCLLRNLYVGQEATVTDFQGGPVAKTPCSKGSGAWVQFLVRKLDPTCHK